MSEMIGSITAYHHGQVIPELSRRRTERGLVPYSEPEASTPVQLSLFNAGDFDDAERTASAARDAKGGAR